VAAESCEDASPAGNAKKRKRDEPDDGEEPEGQPAEQEVGRSRPRSKKKRRQDRARTKLRQLKQLHKKLVAGTAGEDVQFRGQFTADQLKSFYAHRLRLNAAWGQDMAESPLVDVCGFCPAVRPKRKRGEQKAVFGKHYYWVTEIGTHSNYFKHVRAHANGALIEQRYNEWTKEKGCTTPLPANPGLYPAELRRAVTIEPSPEEKPPASPASQQALEQSAAFAKALKQAGVSAAAKAPPKRQKKQLNVKLGPAKPISEAVQQLIDKSNASRCDGPGERVERKS